MMCSNFEWGLLAPANAAHLAGAYGGAGKRGFTGFRCPASGLTRSQQYFYRESLLFRCMRQSFIGKKRVPILRGTRITASFPSTSADNFRRHRSGQTEVIYERRPFQSTD